MRKTVVTFLATGALVGCATSGGKKDMEASSEIIYEDAPTTTAPADPFAECQGGQQQGATVLNCGNLTAAYIPVPVAASEQMVEGNFQQFDKSFPEQSTRERFTQTFGEREAKGLRVYEEGAAPYKAALFIVPTGDTSSLVVSCIVKGSTEYTRCEQVTERLVTEGVPQGIQGLPQEPAPAPGDAPAESAPTDGGTEGTGGASQDASGSDVTTGGADDSAAPAGSTTRGGTAPQKQ